MVVALIAGEGDLPVEIARRLTDLGEPPVIYSFREKAGGISKYALEVVSLHRLDLGGTLMDMASRGVQRVYMAGVVPKTLLYQPAMLDQRVKDLVEGLRDRDDHSLLGAVVRAFEEAGMEVGSYRDLIRDLMAPLGHVAGPEPFPWQLSDVEYGVSVARRIVGLSFGQTVVVHRRSVVAVEAMEGTDATLLRAGSLCRGGTVVKMMRADQDERYDIPTVGPHTLKRMASASLKCLAVEAGRTIILEPQVFVPMAQSGGICVLGVSGCPSS
ncbi:LpxI family protein [Thermanaerovibrio acidaminovorans]|uniref:LpxI family protein n=1 Tax=Thermanaerovibrio acidaminovorans TaxID=81462 RepID=UPI002492255A|nr:UDP-2,3-diacylglucosamine diphosphatase LpxI [Thermanaerovibrio acidaminovorans]